MRAIITNSYYSTNPLTIHWVGRKENGERLFHSFPSPIKPYFYGYSEENGIQKIEADIPTDVRNLRSKYIQTWEADLVFPERVLIDMGFYKAMDIDTLKPTNSDGIKLRRHSLDIETDDEIPLDIDNPKGEILEIGFRDYYKDRTIILTTIKQFDMVKLLELKDQECDKIRDALRSRGLDYLLPHVGNLDIKVIQFPNEERMISFYHSIITDKDLGPDVNVGWYIGGTKGKGDEEKIYGFDIPYIEKRGQIYGIDFNWDHWVTNLDLRQAYMRLEENDLKSTSLEYISQRELGVGKLKHDEGYKQMYLHSPEKFIVYHYIDMLLVQLIDLKREIFEFFQSLSEKVGSLDIGRYNSTYLIDSLLLHDLHGTGQYLPSRKYGQTKKGKIKGGQVFIAVIGRFKIVIVLDFSSEYPSIIETFNISHDSITSLEEADVKLPELGYGFSLKKEGFIPRSIRKLKSYRKVLKRQMFQYDKDSDDYKKLDNEQRAVKELTNAFYGVMGNPHARLYDPRVQGAITYLTRQHIQFVADKINELRLGIEVKYGDTDSVMIHKKEWETMDINDVINEVNNLLKYINDSFPDFVRSFGGDPERSTLDMKFEKIYSSWIQTGAKKNYSGRVIYKDGQFVTPYTEYKGMAPRRSDKSDYTGTFITNLVDFSHESIEKAWTYYEQEGLRWDNKDLSLVNEMGIYISLNQDSYETERQPQKAVARSQKEGIKLDRSKGKFKMYFLSDGPIAINFDETLPKKYIKKIDWFNSKRRNYNLPSEGIANIIRPNKMKDFETTDIEEEVLTLYATGTQLNEVEE